MDDPNTLQHVLGVHSDPNVTYMEDIDSIQVWIWVLEPKIISPNIAKYTMTNKNRLTIFSEIW